MLINYRILYGFSRGKTGDVLEDVSQVDAAVLLEAGLIEAIPDTADTRSNKAVTPEVKETANAAEPSRPAGKRSNTADS